MKLKKINPSFNELMSINVKLHKGELQQVAVNEELAKLMQSQVLKYTKCNNKFIDSLETIIKNKACKMHYKLKDGTCYTVEAKIFSNILSISKSTGALNEKVDIKYFELVG